MIQSPVAVAFLDNHDVIVAEDYRVQRFDRAGRSVVVVGWYSLKPAGVAVSKDGLLAVADKASRTIRFFHDDGHDVSPARRWPDRLFGMPAGMAVVKSTGNIVVVDAELRTVTVHTPSTWPSPSGVSTYCIQSDQLGNPTHVTVDNSGTIFVSDAFHSCIKVPSHIVCLRIASVGVVGERYVILIETGCLSQQTCRFLCKAFCTEVYKFVQTDSQSRCSDEECPN